MDWFPTYQQHASAGRTVPPVRTLITRHSLHYLSPQLLWRRIISPLISLFGIFNCLKLFCNYLRNICCASLGPVSFCLHSQKQLMILFHRFDRQDVLFKGFTFSSQ